MKIAYKGFNQDMTCRGFQFKVGKEYVHEGKVKACESGFHSCEYPLDVFNYYEPSSGIFAMVEADGDIDTDSENSKIASGKIKIVASLNLSEMVAAAIKFTFGRSKPEGASSATGDYGASSSTGYRGASSATGTQGASSSTGYRGASSATGTQGASSATGDYGASSATGYRGASSATGTQGASSSTGDYGASSSTGYRGASSATGYQGASSSTGYRGASSATGKSGIAIASGIEGRAMASKGSAIVLCYYDEEGNMIHCKSAIAGKTKGVKPNVWYTLSAEGKFIEVTK